MKFENYYKFRKIIELIENHDAKIIDIEDYYDFRNFLFSKINKFINKLDFNKIYRKYETIDWPDIKVKYYLLNTKKNKVVKEKDSFYVSIDYEVDYDFYDEIDVYDISWEINGEPSLVTGDILLGFEMKCKINNYVNKYYFVLKNKMVVYKNNIGLGYIEE